MTMTYFTLLTTCVVLFAGSTYQQDESVLDLFPGYTELQQKVKALEASQRQTQSDLKQLEISHSRVIGFSATRISTRWLSKGSTIAFGSVWVDYGISGYNANSGVFVARVAGLYSFSATIMARDDDETVSCGLAVNGAVRSKIYGSTKYAPGVISDVVSLRVNDEVKIKMIESGGIYGEHWSLFSGFLIQSY